MYGGMRSLSQLGSLAYAIYNMVQGPPEPESIDNYDPWVEAMPDRMQMMEHIMPMPYMRGTKVPEFHKSHNVSFGETEPSQSTQDVYKDFLGRDYGLSPRELGERRQMVLSSLTPTGESLASSPAGLLSQEVQMPEQTIGALGKMNQIGYQDQQSYLKNAASVAAYNATKAKSLLGTIG